MAGENTQEASDRISILQDEINRLDQHEKMLDQHKTVCGVVEYLSQTQMYSCSILFQWAQQSIKNILEDVSNFNLAYTTHNDVCSVFPGETLLAIQVWDKI